MDTMPAETTPVSPALPTASTEATEFLESMPRLWFRALLWLILLLVGVLLAWATVSPVDSTVSGRGVLTWASPPTWVRAGDMGTVSLVSVRSGDAVHKGDPLFTVVHDDVSGQATSTTVSPDDGLIVRVRATPGLQVSRSDVLVAVAPAGVPFVFELALPNQDVGRIQPGMTARVRLDAFPAERYGTLPARVERVAAILDSDSPDHPYRITLSLARQSVAGRPLLPALTGTADLVLGQQKLIDLVLGSSP